MCAKDSGKCCHRSYPLVIHSIRRRFAARLGSGVKVVSESRLSLTKEILMLKLLVASTAFLCLLVSPLIGKASTTVTYSAVCKYTGWNKRVLYSGACQGNWGVISNGEQGTVTERYIMTMPKGNEITVYIYANGLASVNGIPARTLRASPGMIKLVTAENEIYEFTEGGER